MTLTTEDRLTLMLDIAPTFFEVGIARLWSISLAPQGKGHQRILTAAVSRSRCAG
jgi:hypothetical protein